VLCSHGLRKAFDRNACLSREGCSISDLLVGVQHDSEWAADSSWWEVFSELGTDHAGVSVALDNGAPDALEVVSGLGVLGSVNVSNALSVVVNARFAVLAALDSDENLTFLLGSLTTLETHEESFLVQSVHELRSDDRSCKINLLT